MAAARQVAGDPGMTGSSCVCRFQDGSNVNAPPASPAAIIGIGGDLPLFLDRLLGFRISPPRAFTALALVVAVCQGCGSDGGPGPVAPKGFTISVGAEPLAVIAGEHVTRTIDVTRVGGFVGEIAYAFGGVPSGMMVEAVDLDATHAAINVVTDPTVAAASYPVAVTASAPGATPQTTTLTVIVSAPVSGAPPLATIAVGNSSSCALREHGAAYCWGSNRSGELGTGMSSPATAIPQAVAGGLSFESLTLSVTGQFACGIAAGGAAYCWGSNATGQLGDGTMVSRSTPTAVLGGRRFASLSAGAHHVCGVTLDLETYCWGLNTFGALGDGTVAMHSTPVLAAPGAAFARVSAGDDYTCALTREGVAYCWGLGTFGQLGTGATTSSLSPVPVSGGLTFVALAAGGLDACGLTAAGTAYCWGHNFYGEVGDGTTTLRSSPVPVRGGLRFSTLSAGFEHFCGVATDEAAYCWGYNETGVLGDGTLDHRTIPTVVAGGLRFRAVAVANGHACGLARGIAADADTVYCWGTNGSGELGREGAVSTTVPGAVQWP